MAPEVDLLKYTAQTSSAGLQTSGGSSSRTQLGQTSHWAGGGLFVDYNNITNGFDEEKAKQTMQSAMSSSLQMILGLFGSNEEQAAKQETQANEQKVSATKTALQTQQTKNNAEIARLMSLMTQQAEELQKKLDEINEESKEKEEKQKAIETVTQTIDQCKSILEDPNRTSAERTAAIAKLRESGESLNQLSEEIDELQEQSDDAIEAVEQAQTDNIDLNDEVSVVIQEGQEEAVQIQNQILTEQTENTATGVKGGVNETISATAKAEAATLRAAAKNAAPVALKNLCNIIRYPPKKIIG